MLVWIEKIPEREQYFFHTRKCQIVTPDQCASTTTFAFCRHTTIPGECIAWFFAHLGNSVVIHAAVDTLASETSTLPRFQLTSGLKTRHLCHVKRPKQDGLLFQF